MTDLNDKVTIIIRSVGERTEQLCRELILAQGVAPANVVIVREAPFSAAMRKSFEIGLERGLPWTFCVDADVLLRPGSLETMVSLAEEQAENVCEIQGYVLDKFFGGPRQAGNHLYRTSLLPLALTKIPLEGEDIRPETHTLNAMTEAGYPWVTVRHLVGLHDFEQYYQDIFRKCFVQAHKHQQHSDLFLSFWRNGVDEDRDYHVALQGFAAGVAHYEDVRIDNRQEIYQKMFSALQIDEKNTLSASAYTVDDVEQIITNWVEPKPYRQCFPTRMGLDVSSTNLSLSAKEKFERQLQNIGPIRIVPYTIGWVFHRLGKGLQTWSS